MIALEQARQHLESLGLKQAVEALDNTLDVAANKQLTYPERLEQLLGAEVEARAGSATCPPGSRWPTSPSSAPWSNSTSPSSLPSTSGRSRNLPTWPSSPRQPTS